MRLDSRLSNITHYQWSSLRRSSQFILSPAQRSRYIEDAELGKLSIAMAEIFPAKTVNFGGVQFNGD
jgi:hypothetical protein